MPWIQHFFGKATLFPFIYDAENLCYRSNNIKILEDVANNYSKMNEGSLSALIDACLKLEKESKSLFTEWYDSLGDQSDVAKFKTQLNVHRASNNFETKIILQRSLK